MSDARVQIFGGGPVLPIEAFASNVTPQANNYTILIDATAANRTVTLPPSSGYPGRIYAIKRTDSSGNTVMIVASGTDTIDGVGTLSLTATMGAILQSDGEGLWSVISSSSSGGGGTATPKAATFVVDTTPGLGDFTTIEAAVAATPVTGADIYVREGAYAPVGTIALPAARNVRIRGAGPGIAVITMPTAVALFSVAGGATAEYEIGSVTMNGDNSFGQSVISIGAAVDVQFNDVEINAVLGVVTTTSTPDVIFNVAKINITTGGNAWSYWSGTAGGTLTWIYVEAHSVTQAFNGITGNPDWDIVDSYIGGGGPLTTTMNIGILTILGMKADKTHFITNTDGGRVVNLEASDCNITVLCARFSIADSQFTTPTLSGTQLTFEGAGGAGGLVENTVSGCTFNGNHATNSAIDVLAVEGVVITACVFLNVGSGAGTDAPIQVGSTGGTNRLTVTGCSFTGSNPGPAVYEFGLLGTIQGRYDDNIGFGTAHIISPLSTVDGYRLYSATAAATVDALTALFTHATVLAMQGNGSIKNTGAQSLTIRRTGTDQYGVTDFQEDPVIAGASAQWTLDVALGTALPPFKSITVSVKSTTPGSPTTYSIRATSTGAY